MRAALPPACRALSVEEYLMLSAQSRTRQRRSRWRQPSRESTGGCGSSNLLASRNFGKVLGAACCKRADERQKHACLAACAAHRHASRRNDPATRVVGSLDRAHCTEPTTNANYQCRLLRMPPLRRPPHHAYDAAIPCCRHRVGLQTERNARLMCIDVMRATHSNLCGAALTPAQRALLLLCCHKRPTNQSTSKHASVEP
jgi:hypothetical protein